MVTRGNCIVKRRGNKNVGQASAYSHIIVAWPPPSD